MRASLGMTGTNVKLDVISGRILAASTDLALGSNAKGGLLLGAANIDLVCNGGGNGLVGNKGADTLKGGAGADDFVFAAVGHSTPGGRNTIADFARRSDDIVLSGPDAHLTRSGDQDFSLDGGSSFSAGEIRRKVTSSGLLLEINTDGDSTAEMAVLVHGPQGPLLSSDFVL